jgi:GH25 family lysozyme M1 (1,4-beta-N-acetylmuramidase)
MIYILGDRAGPNTDPERPLFIHNSTGAAARLARLLDMTDEEYLSNTIRENANGNTNHVSQFLGRANGKPFIVLGKAALKAMPYKYRDMKFGDVKCNVLLLPHTSGVNRVWNDKEFTNLMKARALKHIKGLW